MEFYFLSEDYLRITFPDFLCSFWSVVIWLEATMVPMEYKIYDNDKDNV
jgi:hypothetical protein